MPFKELLIGTRTMSYWRVKFVNIRLIEDGLPSAFAATYQTQTLAKRSTLFCCQRRGCVCVCAADTDYQWGPPLTIGQIHCIAIMPRCHVPPRLLLS